jgi:hypothetical protein
MSANGARLERSSAGFALAASITVLFSTALAWAKDAYKPLNNLMNGIAWHNWITHGLVDVILFFALGFLFSRSAWVERVGANRLITFLVVAVVVAGVGLFGWYAVF